MNRSCREARKLITAAAGAATKAAAVLGIAAIRAARSTTRIPVTKGLSSERRDLKVSEERRDSFYSGAAWMFSTRRLCFSVLLG